MAIQHSAIADADLHQCKGAATAAAGKVPIASGAGTATFGFANPSGSISFINYAAPYVLAYPAAYTKLAPVTAAGTIPIEVTEGNNARLTYTGTATTKFKAVCNLSFSQASGAARDISIALHKNGVIVGGSEIFVSTTTAVIAPITTMFDVSLATNDYVECYVINRGASGDISVRSFVLSLIGLSG